MNNQKYMQKSFFLVMMDLGLSLLVGIFGSLQLLVEIKVAKPDRWSKEMSTTFIDRLGDKFLR